MLNPQRKRLFVTTVVLSVVAYQYSANGFTPVPNRQRAFHDSPLFASRYGPPLGIGSTQEYGDNENIRKHQKAEFQELLDKVMTASKPEHVPSLLAKHTQVILGMQGGAAVEVIGSILEETRQKEGEDGVEKVSDAIDMILSFTEDFVDQSKTLDDNNKQLLGKIIRTMSEGGGSDREREERLDELLDRERENFTKGFLRHLDGEYERIASAPKLTRESTRLQEILMVIKTRILEESGKELGEAAQVLGQLVAYDDKQERMAVLDAGLTVRGIEFAVELKDLTAEALQGFRSVAEVDPTLATRVEDIDKRLSSFIDENDNFQ